MTDLKIRKTDAKPQGMPSEFRSPEIMVEKKEEYVNPQCFGCIKTIECPAKHNKGDKESCKVTHYYPECEARTEKKAGTDYDSNECPFCGYKELDEDFDIGDIYIDPDLGFVTLTKKCPKCKKKLEIFYDHTRTESNGNEATKE